ncbi:hypothetical protein AHMF7605_27330 [Adhaeribacter arboris]|uniref:Uncharacterized protein n=1 Tax=Adhaeribacter arboris TaxID=2072846 RepID=A0A2T2YN48_9BACT|nr:hypothetical protein [Adhaeribacter arboris]PSR56942.1 hypothetical protein AHMF7605_27330 [Adhaeribacter arboris]
MEPVFLEPTRQDNTGRGRASCLSDITPLYVGLVTSRINLYSGENQIIKGFMAFFKPAGFSVLLRRDMAELTGQIPDFSWLTGATEATLYAEQLLMAPDYAA